VVTEHDEGAARATATAETLKALADPTRLRMLSAMTMSGPGDALPVMSVKELAAELGEPQTKLYRHIKQLEAAGLIRAVSSRVVSGIVEQRYQASQRDLRLGDDLTPVQLAGGDMEAAASAALELYRTRFFSAQRAKQPGPPDSAGPAAPPYRRGIFSISEDRVSLAKATRIVERLQELIDLVDAPEQLAQDTPTVVVSTLLSYHASPRHAGESPG
jgi:DNA-binding transcriptional ArsR family regulator